MLQCIKCLYVTCLLLSVNLLSFTVSCFSQTVPDETNVYQIKFYLPREEYRENKVKEVRLYRHIVDQNKVIIAEHSSYDQRGFLVKRVDFDPNQSDSGTTSIRIEDSIHFVVDRSVNKKAVLRKESAKVYFYQEYHEIAEQLRTDTAAMIAIQSFYTLLPDSNLIEFKTFVNGEEKSQGSLREILKEDTADYISPKSDSTFRNDSLIITKHLYHTDSTRFDTKEYFVLKRLIKQEYLTYRRDSLISTGRIIHVYDAKGRKLSETKYGRNDQYVRVRFLYITIRRKRTPFLKIPITWIADMTTLQNMIKPARFWKKPGIGG